ncbi:chromate transporter-domain-containing protein [Gautieria morchelliformis]|nr:chromate transporter-domain-containing protein [Gautieria morchelliformis]
MKPQTHLSVDDNLSRHQALQRRSLAVRCTEVVRLFGPFAFIAFGGPAANIVMLRKIFVVREKWVDDKTFTDLFALGNALPGPSFSQLAFAIALLRGGPIPALLSFVLLTAPGALAMLGLGFGVRHIPASLPDVVFALFSGLNAAAVGLISLAAYDLSAKVITDPLTRIEVLLAAAFGSCFQSQWLYPVLIVGGGLATLAYDVFVERREKRRVRFQQLEETGNTPQTGVGGTFGENIELHGVPPPEPATALPSFANFRTENNSNEAPSSDPEPNQSALSHRRSAAIEATPTQQNHEPEYPEFPYYSLSMVTGLTALFIAFLIIVLVLRATVARQRAFDFFVNLLIAGTIIFGGGPVVVPLLRTYTVDPGWVNARDFLLGFAVIQAIPGPLFNFSVFLGVLTLPSQPVVGGILGCVAIFLPGIVLKMGLLPLYTKWRSIKTTRSVLRGLNAAAVGLIFAATYRLLRVGFISRGTDASAPAVTSSLEQDGWWVVITATTFVGCEWFNLPAPAAIAGGAVGGIAWWGVTRR